MWFKKNTRLRKAIGHKNCTGSSDNKININFIIGEIKYVLIIPTYD